MGEARNSKSEARRKIEDRMSRLEDRKIDLWMKAPLTPALSPCCADFNWNWHGARGIELRRGNGLRAGALSPFTCHASDRAQESCDIRE
jgi:hypothetical protein